MDLIPKPDQIVSAASNVAHAMLYGGLADLRPMPRTLIDDGPRREVYHYRSAKGANQTGDPVLLVTPLAAPSLCFDLRRGCSLVEHFVGEGRGTYLVEYGEISFADRNLGMEHWVSEVIPEAIRTVSEHSGGRSVHVIGWSLGGIFAVLSAATDPTLPVASLSAVGSPFDVTQVPLIAPLRPVLGIADGGLVTQLYRVLGGAPKPLVKRAFQLSSLQKLITKPYAKLRNLDDAEFLAQIEAVDRFTANMIAYPGRTFGQLYHRMIKGNALKSGVIDFGDGEIRLDAITAPVLVFAGNTDGIAPIKAVKPLVGLLSNSTQVRFEIVPGGHLGMLTGRAARETTWPIMDEWISQHSAVAQAPRRSAKRAAAKTAAPTKTAAKKTAPTKAAGKKAAPKKAAPKKSAARKSGGSIGTNPERGYGSAASRGLARK